MNLTSPLLSDKSPLGGCNAKTQRASVPATGVFIPAGGHPTLAL